MSQSSKSKCTKVIEVLEKIKSSKLKLTAQRLRIVEILFSHGHRHVTADSFYKELLTTHNIKVSLATVYNTLHFLCKMDLLKEVQVSNQSIFDTCTDFHAHVVYEQSGAIEDIKISNDCIDLITDAVNTTKKIKGVDIVVKIKK